MPEKIVLAYSGGLDTSVAIRWLKEDRGYDVVALTVDVGMDRSREELQSRAMATGAVEIRLARRPGHLHPPLRLPRAAGRRPLPGPLPARDRSLPPADRSRDGRSRREAEGATAVAHGCTGKGNDQVRLDVGVQALAPDLKIVAPLREWEMDRESEIAYAQEHNIPINVTRASPYSIDENLWGRSIETGVLEDPWVEPPADVYAWTNVPGRRARPTRPTSRSASSRACPSPSTARRTIPSSLVKATERARRRARRRPHRQRRGPPRRHQVARDLRGARRRHVCSPPTRRWNRSRSRRSSAASRRASPRSTPTSSTTASGSPPTTRTSPLTSSPRSATSPATCASSCTRAPPRSSAASLRRSLYDFSLATYDKGDSSTATPPSASSTSGACPSASRPRPKPLADDDAP